ncbi:hypothetical protein VMCG_06428 [Cytospora schulzeri]|uniref:NADH-ubiquinone reductase complex 1 MLRQ subunit n=1 Tax=Cytospora schulzeri TaxID=448051 RepID=A0A423W874_9PEZI|nr:hypothetical protein VMCG_06428 [Valsa malicola]
MYPTRPLMRTPPEPGSAQRHFLTRRLQSIRRIPAELLPLFTVVGAGIVFAGATMAHKLWTDSNLRRTRQNSSSRGFLDLLDCNVKAFL